MTKKLDSLRLLVMYKLVTLSKCFTSLAVFIATFILHMSNVFEHFLRVLFNRKLLAAINI